MSESIPTFHELVQKLTEEHPVWVERENGKALHMAKGLLLQLREAVFGGMENTGGASAFGSKPPIDTAAVDLLTEITDQATQVLAVVSQQPTPYGHAEHYVRLWAGQTREDKMYTVATRATIANPDAAPKGTPLVFDELTDISAFQLLSRWVEKVEDFFHPPSTREINAPCPACDTEFIYRIKDGHQIRVAALNFVRDKETGRTIEARCSNPQCQASWSPAQFEWLSRAVGASMLLSELFEQYQDGDEIGWQDEFTYLRTKHHKRLVKLRESIAENGIMKPILLGPDGRVWDGHHRLCIADEMKLVSVPIKKVAAVESKKAS